MVWGAGITEWPLMQFPCQALVACLVGMKYGNKTNPTAPNPLEKSNPAQPHATVTQRIIGPTRPPSVPGVFPLRTWGDGVQVKSLYRGGVTPGLPSPFAPKPLSSPDNAPK